MSPGCAHCYAARMARRLAGRCGYPEAPNEFQVTLHPERLDEPLHWKKPSMIFVCSMGDLFHARVDLEFQAHVFEVMAACPQHTFLLLTKRPAWILETFHQLKSRFTFPLPNVWAGVTVEDQPRANSRIPLLVRVPAIVKFLSVEPMLEAIWLTNWLSPIDKHESHGIITGDSSIDWVIAGGETGPGARPMHPQWIRELRDQCVETDTPFFFKSWGDWCPKSHTALFPTFDNAMRWGVLTLDGEFFENTTPWNGRNEIPPDFEATVYHIGKKTAGRLLDGRQWDEFPFMARNG